MQNPDQPFSFPKTHPPTHILISRWLPCQRSKPRGADLFNKARTPKKRIYPFLQHPSILNTLPYIIPPLSHLSLFLSLHLNFTYTCAVKQLKNRLKHSNCICVHIPRHSAELWIWISKWIMKSGWWFCPEAVQTEMRQRLADVGQGFSLYFGILASSLCL